ncbi:hypothetical protein QE152_g13500 [Popillia japonica]|uniref:Uncharacterized protein n=1 Tax=Popillia japonica TaxID=7064 RepID=A0AAW1LDJ4_POPJA
MIIKQVLLFIELIKFQGENLTEHRYICYEVNNDKVVKQIPGKQKRIIDWNAFNANMKIRLCNMDAQERSSHKECTAIIGEAYKYSIINGPGREKTIPYWWSDEVNDKRKQCMEAKRGYTKMAKTNASEVEKLRASIKYKLTKKELRKLIRLSKREHWNKLCNDLTSGGMDIKLQLRA